MHLGGGNSRVSGRIIEVLNDDEAENVVIEEVEHNDDNLKVEYR